MILYTLQNAVIVISYFINKRYYVKHSINIILIIILRTSPVINRLTHRVSTTPGNHGNLLEFENPPGNPGNLLEFNGPPANFCVK